MKTLTFKSPKTGELIEYLEIVPPATDPKTGRVYGKGLSFGLEKAREVVAVAKEIAAWVEKMDKAAPVKAASTSKIAELEAQLKALKDGAKAQADETPDRAELRALNEKFNALQAKFGLTPAVKGKRKAA